MNDHKASLGLKKTIIITVAIVTSLMLLFVSIIGYLVSYGKVKESVTADVEQSLLTIAEEMDAWLAEQGIFANDQANAAGVINGLFPDHSKDEGFVKTLVPFNKDILDCYTAYEDTTIYMANFDYSSLSDDYNATTRDWYIASKSQNNVTYSSPYIDESVVIPLPVYAYIAIYLADKFHIKNFVLLHFLPLSTCYLDKPAEIYPAYMPKVRDFLELEIDSEFERYPVNISQHKIEYVNNLFREMGLPHKKTVFLIMDGISNGNLLATREEFFVRLATALKQNGYEVVTKGNRQLIPGCQFTILPPWESTLFAGLCGNVVTIPTGIPFAIGALNQSDEINIHMLWQTVNDATIRQNYDAWNLDHIPMLRTFGKKYFQDVINKTHDLMIDMMFSEKSKFIHYTVEEWNDQTIAKILANL